MTAAEYSDYEAVGSRLQQALGGRAQLNEALGILQYRENSDTAQARRTMDARHGPDGQATEAARLVAVVNAEADGRRDPTGTNRLRSSRSIGKGVKPDPPFQHISCHVDHGSSFGEGVCAEPEKRIIQADP